MERHPCTHRLARFGENGHPSMRQDSTTPRPEHHSLINSYGLPCEDISVSNLVKIDLSGNPVEEAPHPATPPASSTYSAIPAAQCALHTHSKAGCAVAAQEKALLPLVQISMECLRGCRSTSPNSRGSVADLGGHPATIPHHHGLLTVGETCAQAFLRVRRAHRAP
ncbi:class II aldolase/adducin family protein [Streptomyces sviceus]|uniref:class II aldolase/adducin family protein n=1 Tax=Streptomyces sviceus TaxID=285530 RepID=UPI0036EB0FFB